jgi:hypothetical protein
MAQKAKGRTIRPGYRLIFVMSFRHWKTGKIVRRPDGKPFAFLVKE